MCIRDRHKTGDRVYVEVNGSYGYYVVIRSIEKTVDDGSDKIRKMCIRDSRQGYLI